MRKQMIEGIEEMNEIHLQNYQDPEITTRIAQYEMAYQMQMSRN